MNMKREAVLSGCQRYRYSLTRRWGPRAEFVAWILLNPSTADSSVDDPTVRRCIAFSKAWGFDALQIVNLFALRSSKPHALLDSQAAGIDPIGSQNDRMIEITVGGSAKCVAAWGAHGFAAKRADIVRAMLSKRSVSCLGVTANGSPRHPLYVPKKQELVPFEIVT